MFDASLGSASCTCENLTVCICKAAVRGSPSSLPWEANETGVAGICAMPPVPEKKRAYQAAEACYEITNRPQQTQLAADVSLLGCHLQTSAPCERLMTVGYSELLLMLFFAAAAVAVTVALSHVWNQ